MLRRAVSLIVLLAATGLSAFIISPTTLPNGEVGFSYSSSLSCSSIYTPCEYAYTGTLPPGLSLSIGGVISGTPTTAGTYNFTVNATDQQIPTSGTGSRAYTVTIYPRITITTTVVPNGEVTDPYSSQLVLTGGSGGTVFSLVSGALPGGLTLGSGGLISGTPTASGSFNFTVRATDSLAKFDDQALSMTIYAQTLITTTTLLGCDVGVSCTRSISRTGGLAPFLWQITVGSLPPGITQDSASGQLSGTPTTAGSYSFTTQISDAFGVVDTQALTLVISAAVQITTLTVPNGEVNLAYSASLTRTGGTSPYTWTVQAGSLPPGLSIASATGVISGTPTTAGAYGFTIRVITQALGFDDQAYTMTVYPAVNITTNSVADGEVTDPYSVTLSATGGQTAYSWAISAGALPGGLSLGAATGTISGTPTASGSFSFTVRVTDALGATDTQPYTMTVYAAVTITTTTLPGWDVNLAYNQTVAYTGGLGAYSWSISAGTLPAGLTLNASTGNISGTPTTAATYNFTVRVIDSFGVADTQAFTVVIAAAVQITTLSVSNGDVNLAYSATLARTGGTSPYAWSVVAGALPAGLSLGSGTGAITGTPSAAGAYGFTIRVATAAGGFDDQAYTMTVNPAVQITTASIPNGEVSLAYPATTLTRTGGQASYTWSVVAGALPGGLSLGSSSGTISGTPTASGTFTPTIRVTDGLGGFDDQAFTLTIYPAVAITTTSLPGIDAGISYSQPVNQTGGTAAYTWSITAGSLPPGLAQNTSTGAITGTPSSAGTYNFTVRVTDGLGAVDTQALSIVIAAAAQITTVSVPNGEVNVAYASTPLSVTGGSAPYSWSVIAGALPAGLSLGAGGVITGTPTVTGSFSFTVQVVSAGGSVDTQPYSMTVQPAVLITTGSIPSGEVGLAYPATTLATSGGQAAYSWSIVSGALPGGLALGASTGTISGTPSVGGSFTPTVRVTDALGGFDDQAYSLTVYDAVQITTTSLPNWDIGVAYSRSLARTGGVASFSWSISAGALPGGLSLGAGTGVISGTPNATGTFNFTVRITDGLGAIDTQTFTVVISPAIQITTATLVTGVAGSAYSNPLAVSGGTAPLTWSVTVGTLPAGITLNASSGLISGTPSLAGSYNFTVRVVSSSLAFDDQAFTLTVINPLSLVTSLLPDGVISKPYPSLNVVAAGGFAPYTFSLISGAWPAGLSMSGSGLISGTPSGPTGGYPVTLQVTDNVGATASRALTINIVNPPVPAQWRVTGLFGGRLSGLHLSPNYATDRTLFARTSNSSDVYRSTDGGANWTSTLGNPNEGADSLYDLVLSPNYLQSGGTASQQTLFLLGFNSLVRKSVDRGASFASSSAGITTPNVWALGISPNYASDSQVFALGFSANASPHVFYRSVDGGANWTQRGTLPADSWVTSPHFYGINPSPAYATDGILFTHIKKNLYRSTDGGANWTLVFTDPAVSSSGIVRVKVSPDFATDHAVIAETLSNHFFRSTDSGASFVDTGLSGYRLTVAKRAGLPPAWFFVRIPFTNPPYGQAWSDDYLASSAPLYAAGYPNAANETLLTTYAAEPFPASGTAPALFVGVDNGLYRSDDAGLSFVSADRGITAFPMNGVSGAGDHVAACGSGTLILSRDAGVNFSRRPLPSAGGYCQFVELSPAYATDKTLFVADLYDLYRSTDGAKSYTKVFTGVFGKYATQLAFAPGFNNSTGVAYLATDSGLFKSTNGGQSFSAVATLPALCTGNSVVRGVAVSPAYATDSTLFVSHQSSGSNGGLCKSVDGGSNWSQLNDGATLIQGRIALPPTYNNTGANGTKAKTLMAFAGGSFRRSTDGGASWTTPSVPLSSKGGAARGTAHFSPNFSTDNTVLIAAGAANGSWSNIYNFGVFRSADSGATFTALGGADALLSRVVNGLYLHPSFNGNNTVNSAAVAVAMSAGVWRATDGGRAFSAIRGYAHLEFNINAMAKRGGGVFLKDVGGEQLAAIDPGTLLAASDDGVFQSLDGGVTYENISAGLPSSADTIDIEIPTASATTPVTVVRDPASAANRGLYRYNGTSWSKQGAGGNGDYRQLYDDGAYLYAARADGVSLRSADGGATWTALSGAETNLVAFDYNNAASLAFGADPAGKMKGPFIAAANTASLWAVSQAAGPRYSTDNGANWTAAPGGNDYTIPGGQTWTTIGALGLDASSGGRTVVAGTSTGLYLTRDGGATWRSVSGAGSGLEATSKNFTATLSTTTPFGTTDILVGASGTTTGGVYLSGDGGEHWTQINQGFDPAQLSISTLVKTSCAGCPVQYYSGSYGGGLYTRTISVVAPPAIPSVNYACWGSTGCACATTPGSGPITGGQAFKICGSNFQSGLVVEFDGYAATGCSQSGGTVITCTGTPAHAAGYATVRVRNPDTRVGFLPAQYQFTGTSARVLNTLMVAKSGADARLSWTCTGCSSPSARVWRAQNAGFTLYLEKYDGGTASSALFTNSGAVASGQSYFWVVD